MVRQDIFEGLELDAAPAGISSHRNIAPFIIKASDDSKSQVFHPDASIRTIRGVNKV
ncbi:hypothetical protein [Rhizobium sp. BK602]|uniref:hypothetical protein n=1 Tax=Rhizobium sp. BK602 TaxID=2586986 RepID=UPI00160B6E23|nr:hypothetical protein [Rhizobium sp. BK602]MBB3612609.1 hypothetical protein [Rhizobium sp. BK602]